MIISGWGGYPKIDARVSAPQTREEIATLLHREHAIARGGGRAYGDSAISSTNTIELRWFDQFLYFDAALGILSVTAGVQLRDIVRTLVPRGWFLPVTPGTSFATVGGAIASDVHGKNHHHIGTFCQHVREIVLMLGSGEVVIASPDQHPDLFRATCGGMGLTGVILSARIQLVPLRSGLIKQKTLKSRSLKELLELFKANSEAPYSVAWIDCLATNGKLGRSVLLLGEHAEEGDLKVDIRQRLTVPFDAPEFLLSRWNIRAFNELYYKRAQDGNVRLVGLFDYFYPLDKLRSWNRLYGAKGFLQYQFVIPEQRGLENMEKLLSLITDTGESSFLAVIKLFGRANSNHLSFPIAGYTLALDLKISPSTFVLLKKLDDMIATAGGRIYLAKDARITEESFKHMYPNWKIFEEVRAEYGAIGRFRSAQSVRLGLQ